jgi:hypothetical protein
MIVTEGISNHFPESEFRKALYFSGENLAGMRILLYWLTIIACAFGRNACS